MNRYCAIVFALLTTLVVAAQDVKDVLRSEGFENICIAQQGDVVYISLEDPAYRGTFRGPGVALQKLADRFPLCERYEMVVEEYQTPKVAIHASKTGDNWLVNVDYETTPIKNVLKEQRKSESVKPVNPSTGKIDVTFNPIVSLDNHRFDILYEVGLFIAPTIETTLWKGNRINVQPIIPIYTNLDKGNRNRDVQWGSTNIQQDFIFGGKWYGTLSLGTFRTFRMGANIDFGCRVLPSLSIGVRTNWTVNSYFADNKWYVGNKDIQGRHSEVSALLKVDYYERLSSLQVQLTAGRFLYGDWGARLDCSRHFGEYVVGVYGILTGGEHNAGFHFAIPVQGKRNRQSAPIRVNLPEYYDLQYSMVSCFEYADEMMGSELEVRPIENRALQYWQADYIKRNLQKYLDGTLE